MLQTQKLQQARFKFLSHLKTAISITKQKRVWYSDKYKPVNTIISGKSAESRL